MTNGNDKILLRSDNVLNNIPQDDLIKSYETLKNKFEDLEHKHEKLNKKLNKPITPLGLLQNNTVLFVSLITLGFIFALFLFFKERNAVKQEIKFLRNQLPIELENRLNKRIDDTNHHVDEMLRNSKYNFSRGT